MLKSFKLSQFSNDNITKIHVNHMLMWGVFY